MIVQRIARSEYLDKLIALRDKRLIKIVTGVRRCGKSTLMEIYQDYLREQGVAEDRIITVNLEDFDFFHLRDPAMLHGHIKDRLKEGGMNYVFLDEIQQVKDFPRVLDSLHIKRNVDLYITGSNAYLLSSEIATLISGRYVEISMLPLSFREYVSSTGDTKELGRKYIDYLETSSLPYVLELKNQPKEIRDYLDGVYNTIVIKDIATRKMIPDTMMLESVARFVFDNIGNKLSMKKIADTMTSDGRKIDVKTVEKYISALMESFILYQAKRYNVKGKQFLKTLDKYYVVDIGLRNMLLGSRSTDVGHTLENVIYLELIRRGYDVYIGQVDQMEIDFVVMEQKKITYYQVSASVRDDATKMRELAPLQKISDHYPKILLTLDEDPEADYNGIRQINALDWLMGFRDG